jgi:putative ABC transport system permease protein
LGIGVGTALFSVVKAVLLNALPYPAAHTLTWVTAVDDSRQEIRTSLPDFDDWRAQNHSFASLAAYSDAPFIAGGGEAPERTSGSIVTEEFFEVLGVHPQLGRTFLADEHKRGSAFAAVVIGHGLWQRAYGGDRSIVGRKITLLGLPSTVIGVMPPGFAFPAGSELWVSARATGEGNVRTAHNFWVVGRLRSGVSMQAADEDISAIARRLKQQYASPFQTANASAVSLASHIAGGVRTPLLILFGAVGLLIVIVCVNVANLLLVRLAARSRELAVRTAMGAGRWQLVRYLLVESMVLAVAGGLLGLLMALWSVDLLRILLPSNMPRAGEVHVDSGVVAFAIALSMLTGLLVGTLPAWRASLLNIHDVLKLASRGHTASRRSHRLQGALVISEVALSMMLLAGAGLLVNSFMRLRAVDPGFRPDNVLTMSVSLPVNAAARAQIIATHRTILDHIRTIPGVDTAGIIKDLPLDPLQRQGHFIIEKQRDLKALEAGYLIIGPGTMEALRIPMLRGRRFSEADSENSQGVAIVSAEMARRFWPDRDPIGERIWFDGFHPKEQWLTVIGVAGDVRQAGLTEPVISQAYVCYSQLQIKPYVGSANLVLRSSIDPKSIIPALRKIVREVSPEAAIGFRPMEDLLAEATARQRFQMQVLGAFAALALILAAVGLYGVISYTVTSNRTAIGVRMALGAQPTQVFRMIAWQAVGLTSAGAAIGICGCLALRGVLRLVVFGIGPSEPGVLIGAAVVMIAVSLMACWFPARSAMRVDPAIALREE